MNALSLATETVTLDIVDFSTVFGSKCDLIIIKLVCLLKSCQWKIQVDAMIWGAQGKFYSTEFFVSMYMSCMSYNFKFCFKSTMNDSENDFIFT